MPVRPGRVAALDPLPRAPVLPGVAAAGLFLHLQPLPIHSQLDLHSALLSSPHNYTSTPCPARHAIPVAGALFGGGWWFFVDSVATSSSHIPFSQVGRGCLQASMSLESSSAAYYLGCHTGGTAVLPACAPMPARVRGPPLPLALSLQYLPGLIATFALVMINSVRR